MCTIVRQTGGHAVALICITAVMRVFTRLSNVSARPGITSLVTVCFAYAPELRVLSRD